MLPPDQKKKKIVQKIAGKPSAFSFNVHQQTTYTKSSNNETTYRVYILLEVHSRYQSTVSHHDQL